MANYVQLGAGLRQMQNVGAGVLDFQTRQRALDIRQRDSERQDEMWAEQQRQTRLQELTNQLSAMEFELATRRQELGDDDFSLDDFINENPERLSAIATSLADVGKLNRRARELGGEGFSGVKLDSDGRLRLYYRTADGQELPFTGADGGDLGITPREMLSSAAAKAASLGYVSVFRGLEAVTPDTAAIPEAGQGGGVVAQPMARESILQSIREIQENTGLTPSQHVALLMEGDVLTELELYKQRGGEAEAEDENEQLPVGRTYFQPRDELAAHMENVAQDTWGIPWSRDSRIRRAAANQSRAWLEEHGYDKKFVERNAGKSPERIERKYKALLQAREELIQQRDRAAASGLDPSQENIRLERIEMAIERFDKHFYTTSSLAGRPNPTGTDNVDEILAHVNRAVESSIGTGRTGQQEHVMARAWGKHFALEPEGRFKNNSKRARADRAFIHGYITRRMTGQADVVGMRNLMAGDDAAGTSSAQYARQMELYQELAKEEAKERRTLSEAERKELDELKKGNKEVLSAYVKSRQERYSGFWKDADVEFNIHDAYRRSYPFLEPFGFTRNIYENDEIRLQKFLEGMDQAMAVDGKTVGGWLFGRVGGTTLRTSGQVGSSVLPPIMAGGVAIALAAENNPQVMNAYETMVRKHGEKRALEILGERYLDRTGASPAMVQETADE